jgi:lysophospholipase L1-like esterase
MTAKEYCESFAQESGFWDADKAAKAYIIALGVNDIFNAGQPVGSLKDICMEDYNRNADTFAGYYAKIIQRYKEIQPDAKFFLVTKPKDSRDEKCPMADAMTNLLYDLASTFTNTYVIDLRKYAPVYDEQFYSCFFLGGHMNPAGYLLTAKMIASYIDYIIRHNFDDFKKIGFVGYKR